MRCVCCNTILTPQESVRRFKISGEFTDSCGTCLREINMPTTEGNAFDEDSIKEVDREEDDNDSMEEL